MARKQRCLLCHAVIKAHDDIAKITFPSVSDFKRYAHQRCLFEAHLVVMWRRGH